ncbi:MAG: hypothetical protein L6262_00830 [Weeksellaceae bacterium]|nr:hypothetical protein [Weeksellaceae bacterium]
MILCSGVMFTYYLLFLKDKTFHHYNRFYLLLTVIISLVLPLIKVSYFTIETNENLYLLLSQIHQNPSKNTSHDLTIYQIFYAIVGLVSILLLIRLILGLIKIEAIKKQFPNETVQGIRFYQTTLTNAPFSFFKNLFWKESIQLDSALGQQILKHEMVHIQQKHSWDKLIIQLAKSLFWFNPVFYFISKEINLIHEYLADHKAVKKSDTRAFAQMLLESHFSGSVIPVTSPFLSSNLKKRLTMLTKNQTKYSYARKLFALPILFFMVFAYMVNAKNKEIKETNNAIERAVNELKNDTIKPKSRIDSIAGVHTRQLKLHRDALREDQMKISAISKQISEKSQKLNALAKAKKSETPEFEVLQKDIENLGNEIENIVNSNHFQENQKALEEHSGAIAKFYDSPEFKKRMADAERHAAEAEKIVNSPEFKKRIADAEKNANEAVAKIYSSPEFHKRLQFSQKVAKEASANSGKIFDEAALQKILKDSFADANMKFDMGDLPDFNDVFRDFNFNGDLSPNLSPKELKKLEKKRKELQKEQQELLEEQKKLQKKQQELNREMRQNNLFKISFNQISDSPKVLILDNKKLASNDYVTDLYINGVKVENSELKNLDPNRISSMNVITDKKYSTVRIITK